VKNAIFHQKTRFLTKKHEKTRKNSIFMQLYLTFSYIKLKTSKNAKNTKKRYF